MNVPRLNLLEELLVRFGENCSPTEEEAGAIDVLTKGIYTRLAKARKDRQQ